MPWRCALSSASAISAAIFSAWSSGSGPFLEPRGERLALEVRHDEEVRAVGFADVVDAADVRMIERSDRARLALEAQIGIAGNLGREDLDRDAAIEPRVAGLVDLAHPARARAERADDFVRAKSGASTKWQFMFPPSRSEVVEVWGLYPRESG